MLDPRKFGPQPVKSPSIGPAPVSGIGGFTSPTAPVQVTNPFPAGTPANAPADLAPWDEVAKQVLGETGFAHDVYNAAKTGPGLLAQASITPLQVAGNIVSHIPLGGLGADQRFNENGQKLQQTDPAMFQKWLTVKAAADADPLGGGNLRADFNFEVANAQDLASREGTVGKSLDMYMGAAGQGSLGGAVSHALQAWLGIASANVQGFLAEGGWAHKGATVQDLVAGRYSRVGDILAKMDAGEAVAPIEKFVGEKVKSGEWSNRHAQDFLIRSGAGLSSNPWEQIILATGTDPLVLAGGVAGAGSRAVSLGQKVNAALEAGGLAADQLTNLQRVASLTAKVADHPVAGPIFHAASLVVNPRLESSVTKGLVDLKTGVAVDSVSRAYGYGAIHDVQDIARASGNLDDVNRALHNYALDQADLHIGTDHVDLALSKGLGEDIRHTVPSDIVQPMEQAQAADVPHRLTDFVQRNMKVAFAPGEKEDLAARMAVSFGQTDAAGWLARLEKMGTNTVAALHAVTYKLADTEFNRALSAVDRAAYGSGVNKLPLDRLVLMSDNTLDHINAETVLQQVTRTKPATAKQAAAIRKTMEAQGTVDEALYQAAIGGGDLDARTAAWNAAARKYPAIGAIGFAPGGERQLGELVQELSDAIARGAFPVRATDQLADPALKPVVDFLGRNTVDGKPIWNVGFRPDESVAWALKRDPATGALMRDVGHEVSIQHHFDLPGYGSFQEPAIDHFGTVLGSKVGKAADSLDGFIRTISDQVSGARVMRNIEQNWTKTAVEKLGMPQRTAKDIFEALRKQTGIETTNIRGMRIQEGNGVWKATEAVLPKGLLDPQGMPVTVDRVLGAVLEASKGDFLVMGFLPGLTQRGRNMLRRAGIDPSNWSGGVTVKLYNDMRYALNPTFVIQRVTDGPYFLALFGHMPVGTKLKSAELLATRELEDGITRTGMARDFSFDMAEYAPRSNFTDQLNLKVAERVGTNRVVDKLNDIQRAPNTIIANSMTKMLHSQLGSIFTETVNDTKGLLKGIEDPATLAAAEAEVAGPLMKSIDELRSDAARTLGRYATDDEVGLMYAQQMLASQRRVTVDALGNVSTEGLVDEMGWSVPTSFADVQPILPRMERLAREMGYENEAALRADIIPHRLPDGSWSKGGKDLPWLVQRLQKDFAAHPDFIRRAQAYYGGTWNDYFARIGRPVAEGGLDLSAGVSDKLQETISRLAADQGMNPWEYLTGILGADLATTDEAVGSLANMLKAGQAADPIQAWAESFMLTVQPSGRKVLVDAAFGEQTARVKLPEPWRTGPYADKTEEVAVKDLERFMEIDREAIPKGYTGPDYLDELTADIKANGFKEPLVLSYDPAGEQALLGEGNHRLAVAKRLGLEYVPVRAIRVSGLGTYKGGMSPKVEPLVKPNEYGYVPGDLKPSQIGVPVRGPEYASEGRTITPDELTALQERGKALMDVPPAAHPVDLQAAITKEADALYQRTMGQAWGGASFSPRAGRYIEDTNAFMYHSTPARNEASIAKAGINRGEFADLATAQKSNAGDVLIYRSRDFRIKGTDKAPGWRSVSASRPVTPEDLEVSRDGGKTWEPVVAGTNPGDGPWVSAIGKTTSLPIAEAEDPAKFRAALDQFVADNAAELQKPGMYVGTFKDEKLGVVQFDVARATFTESDTEAVQAFLDRKGGAYNVATGNGLFAPKLAPPDLTEALPRWLVERARTGKPLKNADQEALVQQYAKFIKENVVPELTAETQKRTKAIIDAIPQAQAVPYNRSEALVSQLLRDKLRLAQEDSFMRAEMSTRRSVLMRSINHPMLGLYPASYMWGKVLPLTAKALARNPYGLTVDLVAVSHAIAVQRELDPAFNKLMEDIGNSETAFLLDYATPSLPWSEMNVHAGPLLKGLFQEGGPNPGLLLQQAYASMDPTRWTQFLTTPATELVNAAQSILAPKPEPQLPVDIRQLQQLPPPAPAPAPTPTGSVPGAGLAPLLGDIQGELESVLFG